MSLVGGDGASAELGQGLVRLPSWGSAKPRGQAQVMTRLARKQKPPPSLRAAVRDVGDAGLTKRCPHDTLLDLH